MGVEPVVDAVAEADVEIDNGIVVDQYCRTNIEGIFAAGDVANHYHPVFEQRMRVDHWHNALNQGQAAARNMLGKNLAYDEIHWCHRLYSRRGRLFLVRLAGRGGRWFRLKADPGRPPS